MPGVRSLGWPPACKAEPDGSPLAACRSDRTTYLWRFRCQITRPAIETTSRLNAIARGYQPIRVHQESYRCIKTPDRSLRHQINEAHLADAERTDAWARHVQCMVDRKVG